MNLIAVLEYIVTKPTVSLPATSVTGYACQHVAAKFINVIILLQSFIQ